MIVRDTEDGETLFEVEDVDDRRASDCGVERDGLVCDRARGHLGPHRAYREDVDEVLFFGSKTE